MPIDSVVREFADGHGFRIGSELARGFCAVLYQDGDRVLRVPVSDPPGPCVILATERLSLAGGPKVVAKHPPSGSMILERIPGESLHRPPHNLRIAEEHKAREVFISQVRRMNNLTVNGLADLATYYSVMPAGTQWLLSSNKVVYLHADLHHENLLFDERSARWRPIDPQGYRGDPAFESVAFLRNPIHELPMREDLFELLVDRIEEFESRLGWPADRQSGWLYVDRWEDARDSAPDDLWRMALPLIRAVAEHFSAIRE